MTRKKICPLSFRTTPELRRKLEQAARAHGKSLAWEVEMRLMQSFWEDDRRVDATITDAIKR